MPRSKQANAYAFVLWGDSFREIPATIFVGELRRVGIRVKVVGLNAQKTTGHYGLRLIPDITLDQALKLADRAICVIIPSELEQLQQYDNDPRLAEFLELAQRNQAWVIVANQGTHVNELPARWALAANNLLEFPDRNALFDFAEWTARALSTHGGAVPIAGPEPLPSSGPQRTIATS